MKKILPILSLFFLFSCEHKEVTQDAQKYCACKEREYINEAEPGECPKLLQSLKTKYEYLPEQKELLVLRIADCMAGETPAQ